MCSFTTSTLGVHGPSLNCAKTLFQEIDGSGDETVSFTEFRTAAPRLVALGAFWYTAREVGYMKLSSAKVQIALGRLGIDVTIHLLNTIRASMDNAGQLFDWQNFWDLLPLVHNLDDSFDDNVRRLR